MSSFFSDKPYLMGIVNVTPDSFSDGGRYADCEAAIAHGRRLLDEGADLLDIGGESSRPGAAEVDPEEEIRRVAPVVEALAAEGAYISVDTRHAAVMRAAIDAGARMINDISALTHDPAALDVVAGAGGVCVCLMHMQGGPGTMQKNPSYSDVVAEVFYYLDERISACRDAGIGSERIVIDPGIGFGKTLDHNLALLHGLERFQALGAPLLLGASRKSFIHAIDGSLLSEDPEDGRLGGSLAAMLYGLSMGARIFRVHDIAQSRQALSVWERIYQYRQ